MVLVRLRTPPPQGKEHASHSVKLVKTQSTGHTLTKHGLSTAVVLSHGLPPWAAAMTMLRVRVLPPWPQDREHSL
jgi:hypothetical protein